MSIAGRKQHLSPRFTNGFLWVVNCRYSKIVISVYETWTRSNIVDTSCRLLWPYSIQWMECHLLIFNLSFSEWKQTGQQFITKECCMDPQTLKLSHHFHRDVKRYLSYSKNTGQQQFHFVFPFWKMWKEGGQHWRDQVTGPVVKTFILKLGSLTKQSKKLGGHTCLWERWNWKERERERVSHVYFRMRWNLPRAILTWGTDYGPVSEMCVSSFPEEV